MTNKMAINTSPSTIESITQTKQTRRIETEQNHGYKERFDGCQMGGQYREWMKR